MWVCMYYSFELFGSKLKRNSKLRKALYVLWFPFSPPPPFLLNHFFLATIISKYIKHARKEKRVKLLNGIPLRPFSERRFGRNKRSFYFCACGKKYCFLLYCFPSPPVLVGLMEIALTDRCSYWSCNKSLKNMTKTEAAPFSVLWCIC